MIAAGTFVAAGRAIAAIDVEGHSAKVADCKAAIADIDQAIERGQSQLADIRRTIDRLGDGRDGEAAADALLSDAAVDVASAADLRDQADTIRAGLGELGKRRDAAAASLGEAQQVVANAIAAAIRPVSGELERQALGYFELLCDLAAISEALRTVAPSAITPQLFATIAAAGGLRSSRRVWAVSKDVTAMADQLAPLLKLARASIPAQIPAP